MPLGGETQQDRPGRFCPATVPLAHPCFHPR
jgi:hypothetical protein